MNFKRILVIFFVSLILLTAAYFALFLNWSYSSGERAGWIQKLSYKGWVCKTWEGELALVSLPGSAAVEKFLFTVRDEQVATAISEVMGKRVTLHYDEKVGLPTSCFGETRHFVTKVTVSSDNELPAGIAVRPAPAALPAPAPASATTASQ
jgi:ABC-type cobalt transport system substrate-binding protein